MTTQKQKDLEKKFAEKAGELIGEQWQIACSPNETEWPDLIVEIDSEKFGLEVREVYFDESNKGSRKKACEVKNSKIISSLADCYYRHSLIPIKVDFLGEITYLDKRTVATIVKKVNQLSEMEQKRVEICKNSVVYILRLPDNFGEYKRWRYVSDKVGFIKKFDENVINTAIAEKAKKLSKYMKNISDVRLLLVSNKIYNSGRVCLKDGITYSACGFKKVYYLLYPEEARIL